MHLLLRTAMHLPGPYPYSRPNVLLDNEDLKPFVLKALGFVSAVNTYTPTLIQPTASYGFLTPEHVAVFLPEKKCWGTD